MISITGGLLLILGAYFTYRGNIYKSILTYFFADIAWLILSIQSGDYIGAIFVFVGMTLGFLVFLKMYHGKFYKSIKKE